MKIYEINSVTAYMNFWRVFEPIKYFLHTEYLTNALI
jgi:hypothetical protein